MRHFGYYVVRGNAIEDHGSLMVTNLLYGFTVQAEVVPIAMFDGDAEGAPDFTAWVPPEHAHMDDSHASDSKAI